MLAVVAFRLSAHANQVSISVNEYCQDSCVENRTSFLATWARIETAIRPYPDVLGGSRAGWFRELASNTSGASGLYG